MGRGRSAWGRAYRLALVGALACGFFPLFAVAPTENEVKAAYLFNFTKFVQWPEKAFRSPRDPLIVCIWDRDELLSATQAALRDRTTGARRFEVRDRREDGDPAECHLLFMGNRDLGALEQELAAVSSRPVLTIGDAPGFCSSGGIIGLFNEERRVRFEINIPAGEGAGFKFSSNLLQLARLVK